MKEDIIQIASYFEDQDNPKVFATIAIDGSHISFDEGFRDTYEDMESYIEDVIKKHPDNYRECLAGEFNRGFIKVLPPKAKEIEK